jgi:hypothetical protein
MFDSETELKADVREMTGYTSDLVLSDSGLTTAFNNAKRHIRVRKSLDPDFNWFGTEKAAAQDALYWWTCLFSKVQTGELDAQQLQAGAVDQKDLLAKDDDAVTMWYRQAAEALESMKSSSIIEATGPTRSGRAYSAGNFEDQNGGSGGSGGGDDIQTDL